MIIRHATTGISQIFKLILYTSEKIFKSINGSMKTNSSLPVAIVSSNTSHA